MNIRNATLLCLIFILGYSLPALAVTFDEDDYTLLELQYQRQVLGNGVESYLHNGSLYILLIDIVSALELEVLVEPHKAVGYITKQDDTFSLTSDNNQWSVSYNELTENVNTDDIVIKDDLIYVRDKEIENWFGLHFQLAYEELSLSFTSSKKLPIIERLKRQNRLIGDRQLVAPAKNPEKKSPYKLFEVPSIDIRSTNYIRDSKKSGTTNRSNYTLITHGDMGYMNTALFVNGSQDDDIKSATIRMDRFDTTGEMAGSLKLSQISIGDLQHPSIPFAPGSSGRGITIGNDAKSRQTTNNTTIIEGDYYPGQEVELYANGTLIDYQVIPDNGHYLFEDVVLFIGDNKFTLKFYGINGTIETKHRNIRVGDTSDGSSRLKYNFSISQPNQKTIDIDEKNSEKSTRLHSSFTTNYTFGRYLSGNFGYVYAENDLENSDATKDASNNYFNLGLQTSLLGNGISINATAKDDQLMGVSYRLGGYALNTRYTLSTTTFNDLTEGDEDPLIKTNRLEQNYGFSLSSRRGVNSFTLRSNRNRYTYGYNEEHRLGFSSSFLGTNWSSVNTYKVADDGADERFESLNGGLFFSRQIHPVSARLNLAYTVIPESELTTAGLSFSYSPSTSTTANFEITHNVLNNTTDYSLSGSWKSQYLQITPRLLYDDFGNKTATISLFTSLGSRNGRFGNYFNLDTRKRSDRGVIRARLFEDSNLNNTYDDGENLLSGGRILAPQYRSKGISNESGIAWIEHTKPWKLTDIEYEPNSLDIFNMQYSGEPFSVASRPGKITEIDLPFTRTGDIDGTVLRKSNNGVNIPVRGATVVALTDKGSSFMETRTDLDGYFSFEGLPPGVYSVTVKRETIHSQSRNKVTITSIGEFIADYKIVLMSNDPDFVSNKSNKIPSIIKPLLPPSSKPKINAAKETKTAKPKPVVPKTVSKIAIPTNTPIKTQTFPLPKPEIIVKNIPQNEKQFLPVRVEKTMAIQPTISPVPQASPIKETVDRSSYAIKVGSFSNRSYAISSIKKMTSLGHKTFTEVINTSKGIVTRVFIGPITGKINAENVKEIINSKYNENTFVIPFKS